MTGKIKKDTTHILRDEHDPVSKAKRVKITDTEMNMELNHLDGDSVTSHPAKLTASAIGVEVADAGQEVIPALDCSSLKQVRVDVDGSGGVEVYVSPNDSGSFFIKVGTESMIIDVCARRIKIVSVDAIGDVHLVGRS